MDDYGSPDPDGWVFWAVLAVVPSLVSFGLYLVTR